MGSDKSGGSVYLDRSQNRWVASFFLEDGTRKYITGPVGATTRKDKKNVERRLEEAMRQAEQGTLVASSHQTVTQYMESWLREQKLDLKAGSYQGRKSDVEAHIIADLGKWQLQKVKRHHIQDWIYTLCQKGLEASSVHHIYSVFHNAMNDAVERHILSHTPCYRITLPRVQDKEMQVLDPDQAEDFLLFLEKHPLEALITVAIHTGMRQGEILALRWSDIDFDEQIIHVKRNVKYINNEGFKEDEPKTKGSRRSIILTSEALRVLFLHRARQREEHVKAKAWEDRDLVFPNRKGGFQHVKTLRLAFKAALRDANMPDIRFHDLRHTAATLLLLSGSTLKDVQFFLGHSNIATTMRYLHVVPAMQQSAMNRLNSLLTRKKRANDDRTADNGLCKVCGAARSAV